MNDIRIGIARTGFTAAPHEGSDLSMDRARFPARPAAWLQSAYLARVVSPGSFQWEPAVVQSSVVHEWGQTIPATEVTIANQ